MSAASQALALSLREGLGNLIFVGVFAVLVIAVGVWWLKRNA